MTIELSAHAPTSFIEANGIKYAYRRLDQPSGIPLVFLQHFTVSATSLSRPSWQEELHATD